MRILINGKQLVWLGPPTLDEVLKTVPEYCALNCYVIVNGKIAANKYVFDTFLINEGDEIKIPHIMFGG